MEWHIWTDSGLAYIEANRAYTYFPTHIWEPVNSLLAQTKRQRRKQLLSGWVISQDTLPLATPWGAEKNPKWLSFNRIWSFYPVSLITDTLHLVTNIFLCSDVLFFPPNVIMFIFICYLFFSTFIFILEVFSIKKKKQLSSSGHLVKNNFMKSFKSLFCCCEAG